MENNNESNRVTGFIIDSEPVIIDDKNAKKKISKSERLERYLGYALGFSTGILIFHGMSSCMNPNKNINNSCTLITIYNHEIHIYDNVRNTEECNDWYKVTELSDKNWLIYVYGVEAPIYSEFIVSNISFDEDNNILFDSNNLTVDNYEYFKQEENNVRTRK